MWEAIIRPLWWTIVVALALRLTLVIVIHDDDDDDKDDDEEEGKLIERKGEKERGETKSEMREWKRNTWWGGAT